MSRTSVALLLLGAGGVATTASAADLGVAALGSGYTASDAPLGAPSELAVDLRGEVPARCRLASPPVLGQRLDFNRAGDVQARFGLDCNAPFQLRIRSGEGAFVTDHARQGIASRIAYDLSVDVDTDEGLSALGWCRADQLTDREAGGCAFGSGDGWSSGDATAIDRTGTMRLRWSAPREGDEPVYGRYRDTIIVELAVRA
ncbi:hypothetical protein [Sphingopyxis sp.]|uniref:hypothetical protein n=1 Tax=Sphingopyxis sp. TaxID=1908224 RepID=UPI00262270A7|nr:hypothetical protein [Sphingopyxis sp.]MCW0196762.1 hypothetical protein [Sphingopyxis sp.]